MNVLRKGATGIQFDVQVEEEDSSGVLTAVDLTSVTTKTYTFTRPSGITTTVAASFRASGSDGWLRYVNVAGAMDLNEKGIWTVEVNLVFPAGGYVGPTFAAEFRVK